MAVRNLLIAAILLATLAGVVWWSERSDGESAKSDESSAPDLVKLTADEITRVVISRAAGQPEIVLERGSDATWRITSPETMRASRESIDQLLNTFTDLRWDRLIEEKAVDLAAFGLKPPAVRVTATGKNGTTQTVLIGDQTPSGSAWYATLEGDPRLFTISDFSKGAVDKQVTDLRDKQLLTFETTKVQRIEVQKPAGSVEFSKSGEAWTISKPGAFRADNYQVQDLVDKLQSARMDLNISPEEIAAAPARFASGSRVATANVVTADGQQTLEVRKAGEHYHARSSVTEGTYRLEGDLGEALGKGLDDYRNRKLFEFGFSDPSRVEVKDAATTYVFTKSGEHWTQDGKRVDPVGVQSLIDKLRELTAQSFGGSAVTSPDLTMTVTAGGRSETVVASGTSAQRPGEAPVYTVDAASLAAIRQAAKDVKPAPAAAAGK